MFKLKSTINHLHNLMLQSDTITSIVITLNGTMIQKKDETEEFYQVDPKRKDYLQNLYDNISINPDMCIDCMTDDNITHNEFFKHSVKSYIDFLLIEYGPIVRINKEMAQYFIKHSLLHSCELYYIYPSKPIKVLNLEDFNLLKEERFALIAA